MSIEFDIFAALAHPGSEVVIHNVRLIDVQPGEDGYERLTIEQAGITRALIGRRWNEQFSRRNVGKIGYLVPARPISISDDLPIGACYFYGYIDQSLRRVPELDSDAPGSSAPVGWYCDAEPQGFRAPVGIIPGERGGFVPDETVSVTLRVPPEFVRECSRVRMTPEELLRSFVGDLAGIQNFVSCPRADSYGSSGSDERDYAQAWLDRAHGMNAIDLNELENREFEAEERQGLLDDFAGLLDDFEHYGGNAEELLAIVSSLVDQQQASGQASSSCGYTCSADPEHKVEMDKRHALARLDNPAWRASFDEFGRYLDPESGFWESLNGELYSLETKAWLSNQR